MYGPNNSAYVRNYVSAPAGLEPCARPRYVFAQFHWANQVRSGQKYSDGMCGKLKKSHFARFRTEKTPPKHAPKKNVRVLGAFDSVDLYENASVFTFVHECSPIHTASERSPFPFGKRAERSLARVISPFPFESVGSDLPASLN